jgi:ABC-type sugar transport system ATPase subunit
MSNPKALFLKAVSFSYEKQRACIIDRITLEMTQGERVAILGESGSGKSTLIGLLSGLLMPSQGQVLLAEKDINRVPYHERNIALVLQRPPLLLGTTVHELLRRPARRNGPTSAGQSSGFEPKGLGMRELAHRRLSDLSGGELQRVHIARSLVWKPDFILLDEPFNSIDVHLKHSIYPIIRQHQSGSGSCLILVTHDPTEALLLCKRIVIIRDGIVLADSGVEVLLAAPPNLGSARLIGGFATNVLDADLTQNGTEISMETFLGKYHGSLENDGNAIQLPAKAKALFRWNDIIGQPVSDDQVCCAPVFYADNGGPASFGPTLYMHERWTVYGRSLATTAEKATLGLAVEKALLYHPLTERLLGVFKFSQTQEVNVEKS